MEKGSEAKNNEYPQELKGQGAAALLLASLKYKILDKKTASALHASKSKVEKESKRKKLLLHADQNIPTRVKKVKPRKPQPQPQVCLPIDDYTPPAKPPVACLSGLIGICSKPLEKQLTLSDVRDDQSRLSIHRAHAMSFLLPLISEKEKLCLKENRDHEWGVPVTTYDLDGNQYPMIFKIWSEKLYVLTSGWKRFFHDHGLRKHQDFVTIWMFRHAETGNLCFVITWRRLEVYEPIKRRRVVINN